VQSSLSSSVERFQVSAKQQLQLKESLLKIIVIRRNGGPQIQRAPSEKHFNWIDFDFSSGDDIIPIECHPRFEPPTYITLFIFVSSINLLSLALVLMPHVFDFPLDFDLCYIFLLIVSWFSTLAKMWRNVSICERNSIKMFLDLITYFRRYMRYAWGLQSLVLFALMKINCLICLVVIFCGCLRWGACKSKF